MPFATTWSEELVAEWLAIEGYLVETNVPIGSGRGGGRREADIIGVRIERDRVNIIHAEVASFAESPNKTIPRYKNKFYWGEKYIKERWKQERKIKLKKLIVGTWISENMRKAIREGLPDVKLITFEELLEKEIYPIVGEYVRKFRVFPENFWLLNFLWYLKQAERKRIGKK